MLIEVHAVLFIIIYPHCLFDYFPMAGEKQQLHPKSPVVAVWTQRFFCMV